MASLLVYRDGVSSSVPPSPPLAGIVIGVILFTSAISILSWFLTQRSLAVKTWWHLPSVAWLVFTLYVDSWTFVFATGIINYGIGIDSSESVCSAAILSYLFCYTSTKLIYMFLIEKAFIIRGGPKKRLESKIYLFNSFGILTVYGIMSILNFVYRDARFENGQCIIGIGRQGLIPLITLDIAVMAYLTILFLNPLRGISTFQIISSTPTSPRLRNVAIRTFIGALCTTTSTVINLIVLMVLDGEPGWVFLTCCNADILFSAITIQWVTRHDPYNTNTSTSSSFTSPDKHTSYHPPPAPATPLPRRNTKKLAISLPLKTTSTSQYEHIFGDPDPPDATPSRAASGVLAASHKFESTSLDENDDATILTPIPKPIPVEINLGRPADIPTSPTLSLSYSHLRSRTPSHNRSRSRSRKTPKPKDRDRDKDKDPDPDRSWLSTLTRTHAQTQIADQDLVPAPLSPIKPPEPPSVSAAVAADLERIRRYRDRRAPTSPPPLPAPAPALTFMSTSPSTSAPASTSVLTRTPTARSARISRGLSRTRSVRAPGGASQYRISELAFEGDEEELPWHDLVVMEEGDGDRADLGGWI